MKTCGFGFLIVIYALANKPAIVYDGQIVDYLVTSFAEWEDVLSCLKKQEQEVLLGIYFHGYTVSDLAKQYSCTRQNINHVKQRALKKLRKILTEK